MELSQSFVSSAARRLDGRMHELHGERSDSRVAALEGRAQQRRIAGQFHRGQERSRRDGHEPHSRHASAPQARILAAHAETLQARSSLPRKGCRRC